MYIILSISFGFLKFAFFFFSFFFSREDCLSSPRKKNRVKKCVFSFHMYYTKYDTPAIDFSSVGKPAAAPEIQT